MPHSNALAMSFTWINGLHGVPSLRMVMFFEVTAQATKSFTTRSSRRRSLIPHAVANRRQVTRKLLSASFCRSVSVLTLDIAYAVSGLSGEVSLRGVSSAMPYMLQLEANTKERTPAAFACFASSTLARWLIAYVTSSKV